MLLIIGTAAVAVAGLLAALRITKTKMHNHTIVFQGAGEVGAALFERSRLTISLELIMIRADWIYF